MGKQSERELETFPPVSDPATILETTLAMSQTMYIRWILPWAPSGLRAAGRVYSRRNDVYTLPTRH